MKIGIDVDNTITYATDFFCMLTNSLKGKAEIHIVTSRDISYLQLTKDELDKLNIHYDYLFFTDNKTKYVIENSINIFFDDMDEFTQNMPENVIVFKIRELMNFDWNEKKWLYSHRTGLEI